MAWISVHEPILGGKLRKLAKSIGCSQNEALGILIRLWLWGINNADAVGIIVSANKHDITEILAVGLNPNYSADAVVDCLIETRWIDVGTDGVMYLHDWNVWQKQWYKALATREYDVKRKREAAEKAKNEGLNNVVPKPDTDVTKDEQVQKNTMDANKPPSDYTSQFEEFWAVYPRHIGKKDAFSKYKARLKKGWTEQELYQAALAYRNEVLSDKRDEKFIKHASTFLSDKEPFIDYLPQNVNNSQSNINDDFDKNNSFEDIYNEWGDG